MTEPDNMIRVLHVEALRIAATGRSVPDNLSAALMVLSGVDMSEHMTTPDDQRQVDFAIARAGGYDLLEAEAEANVLANFVPATERETTYTTTGI